jgi:hypothetical protein
MRLRKLIVLGALVAFVGGMSSCAKKEENTMTDSTAMTTTPTPTTAPPPPPPAPDTTVKVDTTVHMEKK